MFSRRDRRSQGGVTLIELIVFIVVVSVGLAGVLAVFNVTVQHSADPLVAKQALALAEATLEEVLLKDFVDPGGPPETGRAEWDNVSDYAAYVSPPIPGLPGYALTIAVVPPVGGPIGGVPAADILQVTVNVAVGTENYALTGYRFNY